jgi:2,3-bisphosphoglycerate-dependent phosphoglycerate mutase
MGQSMSIKSEIEAKPMGKLILSRHGESEFNAKSLWTGIWDIPLTRKGRHDAETMAQALAKFAPDTAYTSGLIRASDTLKIILHANGWKIPVHHTRQFNERDYGQLTGLNKWEVENKYGQDQFTRWRRGWNEPVPDGETLKDVYARAVPYFEKYIEPQLRSGQTVLITAHGNALRALIKYLDKLSDKAVESLEMPFGELLVYDFNGQGSVTAKNIIHVPTTSPPA